MIFVSFNEPMHVVENLPAFDKAELNCNIMLSPFHTRKKKKTSTSLLNIVILRRNTKQSNNLRNYKNVGSTNGKALSEKK